MPGRLSRRALLRGLGGALGSLAVRPLSSSAMVAPSCAQLEGERIRWLVGWAPGGGYDLYSRLVEPTLEERLRAQIVVENIPGAAGLLAVRRLMSAAPDGRTLGIVNGTGLMLAPILDVPITPDLETDLTVLGRVVPHRQVLAVGVSGLGSVRTFVETGRRRPLVLGATGLTTFNTLLTALLPSIFGVDIEVVLGYPGSRQLLAAVARGELDGAVIGVESSLSVEGVVPVVRLDRDGEADDSLADVPALIGPNSIRALEPDLLVADVREVESVVSEVVGLMQVGRLAVGPPGLTPELRDCLRGAFAATLGDPSFLASAERANHRVSFATADDVLVHVAAAKRTVPRFAEPLRDLIQRSNRTR